MISEEIISVEREVGGNKTLKQWKMGEKTMPVTKWPTSLCLPQVAETEVYESSNK